MTECSSDLMTLSHGPIPALKWGPMTMEFKSPPPSAVPRNLEAGDPITFEFTMEADGTAQLTRISPMAREARPAGASK